MNVRRFLRGLAATLLAACLAPAGSAAQESVSLTWPDDGYTLQVHVTWGAIELRPSNGELRLRAENDDGQPTEVLVTEDRNRIVVRQPPPAEGEFESANLFIEVPAGGTVSVVVERGGDVLTHGLEADLEITNHNGSVDVLRHSGSAVVNATNGTIRANVVEPNERPLLFSTLNGSAHICLGGEPRREVLLSTQNDDILTDFAIDRPLPAEPLPPGDVLKGGAPMLRGTIGGGGPLLRIATSNGDVLLSRCR